MMNQIRGKIHPHIAKNAKISLIIVTGKIIFSNFTNFCRRFISIDELCPNKYCSNAFNYILSTFSPEG